MISVDSVFGSYSSILFDDGKQGGGGIGGIAQLYNFVRSVGTSNTFQHYGHEYKHTLSPKGEVNDVASMRILLLHRG